MLRGIALRNHLLENNAFAGDDTLCIIDDYHTKNISDEAIEFYGVNFSQTGLRKITIYYQVKKLKDRTMTKIENFADRLGIDISDMVSYLLL